MILARSRLAFKSALVGENSRNGNLRTLRCGDFASSCGRDGKLPLAYSQLGPMPRRELLTSSERDQLLALPGDYTALVRIATLSRDDLAFIGQHRGDHNRLGVGIQLCYLRHLGRVLSPAEVPDPQLLGLVAAQLKVSAGVWDLYANRDQTRREHLQEILDRLSLKQFDRVTHRLSLPRFGGHGTSK